MNRFAIPAGRHDTKLEFKRSQFITCINHTPGTGAARAFITGIRAEYPDANHHCYAYVAGAPDDIYQINKSDDGEPRGTAGKPMLNVLQHSGVGEITVIVVRYFGGVKLGAGGLVRAYTQCVSSAMQTLITREFILTAMVEVELPYTLLARVEHWLASTLTNTISKEFGSSVQLVLDVPVPDRQSLEATLNEIGQGAITWRWLDQVKGKH